ncbi:MAG: hypothetical protein IJD40_00320 [Lachnospiraceae bacterium]|nr:hypothetical protein [Lachnospiraceae bacterium]
MKKIFTLLLICVLLITTCTGCQLALPEESTAGDELIGMYVTTEDLRDFDNIDIDLFGNISMEQSNEGKIYGTFDEKTDTLTFPDITGYPLFLKTEYDKDNAPYHSIITDASEANYFVNVSDTNLDNIEISGTFYYDVNKVASSFICHEPEEEYEQMEGITRTTQEIEDGTIEYVYTTPGEEVTVYCNSLYKTPTDEFYIIPEAGFYLDDNQSQSCSSEAKVTSGKNKKTINLKVTAHFKEMIPMDTVTFTQMDENGQALQEDSYCADTIPESYAISSECQYVFVTNTDTKGNTQYDIINKDEDGYSVYFSTEHIFCQQVGIEITHK